MICRHNPSEYIFNELYCTVAGLSRRRMIWLLPLSPPPSHVASCLSFSVFFYEMEGRGGEGAKSYDGEKAWFSIIH
jgi:hypothetical protein